MKFSIVKNDKSTYWDEVILGLMSFGGLAIGIMLIILKPSFWVIDSSLFVVFGVLIAMLGFMFAPCFIYRLLTNDKKNSNKKSS